MSSQVAHGRPWVPHLGFTALALAGTLACGEAELPEFEAVAEPEHALRPAPQRGVVPEDAHVVDTRIDARLDERNHEIHGTLRMAWRNTTERSVDTLPFHLYMNGFRAADTEWMATSRGSHRGQEFGADRWGFVDVSRVELLAQTHDGDRLELEQRAQTTTPLAFAEDPEPSTMTVTLPEALGPGESVMLEIEFLTRLPQVFARTGYFDTFHMAGQWFPKIGVLEEQGGWQAHAFSLNSEFYADFGNYEVFLDVPASYVVGASGIRVGEEELEDDRKRLHYRAEMVHDFAWVADPDFVEHWGEYEGIRIRQLIQPEHVDDAAAHMAAQIAALESMEARFGPYPWSTITIVHAPKGAGGAGGMEYPTLYTTSDIATVPWIPAFIARERFSGVFTTVHEFGHQYFQGMFASNEHAQPWLDEGLNTTSNQLVYWDAYGVDPWVLEILGHPITTKDILSLSMLAGAGQADPIDQSADRFDPLVSSYSAVSYSKTAAVMLSLREITGREPWDKAMARYAELARFRHPDGALLERVLIDEIGGEDGRLALVGEGGPGTVWLDVADYLDQGLRDAGVADFRVHAIGNRPRLSAAGWHRHAPDEPLPPEPLVLDPGPILAATFGHAPPTGPDGLVLTGSSEDWGKPASKLDEEQVEGYVIVRRASSFRVPVEIRVEFSSGEPVTVMWDGQDNHHRFDFPGRRVTRAIIDPDFKLLIEARRLDNVRRVKPKPEEDPLVRWLGDSSEASQLAVLGALGI